MGVRGAQGFILLNPTWEGQREWRRCKPSLNFSAFWYLHLDGLQSLCSVLFHYYKRVIFQVPNLACFVPETPIPKSSCFSLNNWMLLVGCEESFCKSTDDSWQHLGCSCKHRQGRIGSVAPVSSTFAPGEHLREMASIAQGLWWCLRGMLQQWRKKHFSPMITFFYAKEETHGSLMGLDLFWGYCEPYIQDGFLFEGEGVEPKKKCSRQNSLLFSITLEDWSVHKCLSGEAKLFTKSRFLGACPSIEHVVLTPEAEAWWLKQDCWALSWQLLTVLQVSRIFQPGLGWHMFSQNNINEL